MTLIVAILILGYTLFFNTHYAHAWWFWKSCPTPAGVFSDPNYEVNVKIAKIAIDTNFKTGQQTKILEASNGSISNLKQIYDSVCRAYKSDAISEDQYKQFVDNWLGSHSILLDQLKEKKTVILLDAVRNAYGMKLKKYGASNADDLLPRLSMLEARIEAENVSGLWARTANIVARKPTVVIIHFSAFENETVSCVSQGSIKTECNRKFFGLVQELLSAETKPRIIVYSRTPDICMAGKNSFRQGFRNLLQMDDSSLQHITLLQLLKTEKVNEDFETSPATEELIKITNLAIKGQEITFGRRSCSLNN